MNPELFAAVETYEFAARLNVVSGYAQFLRALAESTEVKALLSETRAREQGTLDVFYRLLDLVSAPFDPAYENPADTAISAYLLVLCFADHDIAALAAELVLECGGLWWAKKLALAATTGKKKQSASVRAGGQVSDFLPSARASQTAGVTFVYCESHGQRPSSQPIVGRLGSFSPSLRDLRSPHRNRGARNVGVPGGEAVRRNRGASNKRQTLEAVA